MSTILSQVEFITRVNPGETFNSLIEAGKYDWKWDKITEERFPIRHIPVGKRKLVLLHFGRGISSEDTIAEAAKQGLERPTYEDCLRFGAQYPQVQRQFPLVFLHEPVQAGGNANVLRLGRNDSRRYLSCSWFGSVWYGDDRFVFVQP